MGSKLDNGQLVSEEKLLSVNLVCLTRGTGGSYWSLESCFDLETKQQSPLGITYALSRSERSLTMSSLG